MTVAYFSMEAGVRKDIPTVAGGLGFLAGDHLKSAADLGIPLVGISLLYSHGYHTQHIAGDGWQTESYPFFDPSIKPDALESIPIEISAPVENREVHLRVWRYTIKGTRGEVPLYFLDANHEKNMHWDAALTKNLYGGDHPYFRVAQESLLGIGGARLLKELGLSIDTYHMNEGHAAFLTLELLKDMTPEEVRQHCVFTTHTPVPAGHDRFSYGLAKQVVGSMLPNDITEYAGQSDLSMTLLAMNLSRYTNAVSKMHADITRQMFPGRTIDYITNGVHSYTWTSPQVAALFDALIPSWRDDPVNLKDFDVLARKLMSAHQHRKANLIDYLSARGLSFDEDVLTLGFARRGATYKRQELLLLDIERLKRLGNNALQLVFAGKAHPMDQPGKEAIQEVIRRTRRVGPEVSAVYLENYDMALGELLTSSVDVWVNTPRRGQEASGTSGMKAAHNGVLNFSVLDGWWPEGHIEDMTGWAIGPPEPQEDVKDNRDLLDTLEQKIIPLYYKDPTGWATMQMETIRQLASHFNTHRMVREYEKRAY